MLIDVQRSMHEKDYVGVCLSDPTEKWVFCSPMSWHPDGRHMIWPEVLRGTKQTRIRRATLLDYTPEKPVPFVRTPDSVPYGVCGDALLAGIPDINISGKIAGKHSGYIEYTRTGTPPVQALMGKISARYVNYSDDGKSFYNGYEQSAFPFSTESTYEADISLTGMQQGEMKLRVTFAAIQGEKPAQILFDDADDGKPKSYGCATYKGKTLYVTDLLP